MSPRLQNAVSAAGHQSAYPEPQGSVSQTPGQSAAPSTAACCPMSAMAVV